MDNPFKYGGPVSGAQYVDREADLARLEEAVRAGQKVFLISPRRYGKTSLLLVLARKLREEGVPVVFVDLFAAADAREFLALYSTAVLNAVEGRGEKALRIAKDVLTRLRPRMEIGEDGRPALSVDVGSSQQPLTEMAGEILDLPEKLAARRGRRMVVIIDEFQEITTYRGETWEKMIRSVIQHHDRVGYVFAGSREHLLRDMLENRSRAFYGMGSPLFLGLLPEDAFVEFIRKGFERAGISVPEPVARQVIGVCEGYPYNVQYLCHVLWNQCRDRKRVGPQDIDSALLTILDGSGPLYAPAWESLPTRQRALLRAVASGTASGLLSTAVREVNRLGPASSVAQALESLTRSKEILRPVEGGHAFADVFFKLWVLRVGARTWQGTGG